MLGCEEFEDQLTHALLVLRLKFEKLDPDRKRLNRADHRRIHLDIGLPPWRAQQKLYKRPLGKRRGSLQSAPPHRNVRDHSIHRGWLHD